MWILSLCLQMNFVVELLQFSPSGHVPGTSGQTAGCHESKQFLGTSGAVHRSHQKL